MYSLVSNTTFSSNVRMPKREVRYELFITLDPKGKSGKSIRLDNLKVSFLESETWLVLKDSLLSYLLKIHHRVQPGQGVPVVIKIIQPPLQIRFIDKINRLSALCDEPIKQKSFT